MANDTTTGNGMARDALRQRGWRSGFLALMLSLIGCVVATPALAQGADDSGQPAVEDINVTGRREFEARFQSTASRITINRRDIEAMGANSIADILRNTPGVQVTTTANGGIEIRMRGMGAEATRIQIDGVAVSQTNRNAQLPLEEFPADLIERIEVLRAPTAESQGAAGGTLNIVLRGPSQRRETIVNLADQLVWGRHGPGVFASFSGPLGAQPAPPPAPGALEPPAPGTPKPPAPGTLKPPAPGAPKPPAPGALRPPSAAKPPAVVEVPASNWAYLVNVNVGQRHVGSDTHRETATNTAAPTGSTIEDEVRIRNRFLTVTPRLTGRLGASDRVILRGVLAGFDQAGKTVSNATGLSNGVAQSVASESPWRFDRGFFLGGLDWSHSFKGGKWDTTAQLERSTSDNQSNRNAVVTLAGVPSASNTLFNEARAERGFTGKSRVDLGLDDSTLSFGGEIELRRLDVDSTTTAGGPTVSLDYGARTDRRALWTQIETPFEDLKTSLAAGLRAQDFSTELDSATTSARYRKLTWQPTLNTRTAISEDLQFRFNLARLSRNPRIFELANLTQPNLSTNSVNAPDSRGNPTLRPEVTISLDTGLEQRLAQGGQAGVNVFVRRQTDVIRRRLFLAGTRWTEQPDNIGDALVWGLEGDIRTNLVWAGFPRDWTLSSHLTLLNSKLDAGVGSVQRIPGQARYLANLNIAKPMRPGIGWFGGGTLALTGASDQNTTSAAGVNVSGRQRSHAQLDFFLGHTITGLGFWRVNVNNLTNYRQDRTRTVDDTTTGVITSEHSVRTLTPRVVLTLGMRL